ncbi:MAG: hypothetical protein RL538_124 [Candidatus Parcubacteria bacterium]|jgi:hypothetical protein
MLQLSVAEVSAINIVVRSVRNTAHRQTLAARRRDAAEAEKQKNLQRRTALHQERFLGIISRAEKGWLSLLTALRTPKLQELFSHTPYFELYSAADEATNVAVAIVGNKIELSITGTRVSSCQAAGMATSYRDCHTTRRYIIIDDFVPVAFFRSIFAENFDYEWFDWLESGEDWSDESFAEERARGVDSHALKQFFSFSSTSIFSQTQEMIEDNDNASREGFQVLRAWEEMHISPGWVLVRFFHDCADPEVLGRHLSDALKRL